MSHSHAYMYVRTYHIFHILYVGELVGFIELDDVNTQLADFRAFLGNTTILTKTMAKSILVLMVRGLNSGLQFPDAELPCSLLCGNHMFPIVWKAIGHLQQYGFHVLGLACGSLSANLQLFSRHAPKRTKKIVQKTSNSSYLKYLSFFLSNPPHFLKTIRDCFANKNCHMRVNVSVFLL